LRQQTGRGQSTLPSFAGCHVKSGLGLLVFPAQDLRVLGLVFHVCGCCAAAQIDMPDEAGRQAILRVLLSQENVAADVDYRAIAAATPNYSGSDLKVQCFVVVERLELAPSDWVLFCRRCVARLSCCLFVKR
jgi:hypothetical protein